MCIIIARRRGCKEIPEEYIEESAQRNRDGLGIVAVDQEGNVFLDKTLDMRQAVKFIRLAESRDLTFVAHMRIRTEGRVDLENCHPYRLHGANYLAHNGIIHIPTPVLGMSDTWHMTSLLKDHAARFHKREQITVRFAKKWFAQRAGALGYNKFALLGADLPLTIIGKEKGEMEGGVWYSNTSYRPWKTQTGANLTVIPRTFIPNQGYFDNAAERLEQGLFVKIGSETATWNEINRVDKRHQFISQEIEYGDAGYLDLERIKRVDPEAWNTLYKYYHVDMNEIYNPYLEEGDLEEGEELDALNAQIIDGEAYCG